MEKITLENAVKSSKTKKECLEKLGLRSAGGNYKTIDKYIKLYGIKIDHFESDKVKTNKINILNGEKKIPLQDILISNSNYNRCHLKKRLYLEGLKGCKCELCGQGEIWNGKKMSLILDHINGIWNDNRIENLRLVCPNCNATLDTHCGKNKKRMIRENNKNGKSIDRRKVERPTYIELLNDINKMGYVKTGKKYGVSDNSIRKWVRWYEKYGD